MGTLSANPIGGELILLGTLLLLALGAEALGRHTRLPRISLLILLGFLLGPAGLSMLDPRSARSFEFIALVALSMVGFLVGGKLSPKLLRQFGGQIMWLSLWEALVTYAVVASGLLLVGASTELALILAAIATATDPAATFEAIRETRRRSRFSGTLAGVVAVDDAWGLIAFSVTVMILQALGAEAAGVPAAHFVRDAGLELFGAILLGGLLGLPLAFLSGRIRPGEPTLMEALGMVLLCAGLAQWLDVSPLLAAVALGVTVANLARHHQRPFHAVEEIEWPFLALFFLYCGAYLTREAFAGVGWLLLAYLLLRVAGRCLGGWLASMPARVDSGIARWMGLAMLPQAGVAMAMAVVGVEIYPRLEGSLLPVVITATVLFELLGPLVSRRVLAVAGRD